MKGLSCGFRALGRFRLISTPLSTDEAPQVLGGDSETFISRLAEVYEVPAHDDTAWVEIIGFPSVQRMV